MQDVRGRYASDGHFDPYRQEGADGYDTIEWAAAQPWSDGRVGTYGLSYPGAVQWLAALEAPPHLVAMAPAMTFSSPRRFFYMNGIFDRSWLPWIYQNIAPDARRRLGMPDDGDAEAELAGRSPASSSRGCRCATCPGCGGKRRTISNGWRIRRRTPGGTGRSCAAATGA